MRLTRVHARLPRAARDATHAWWERSALWIELDDGRRGEAAPLPGRSRETLDDVQRALEALGDSVLTMGPDALVAHLGPSGAAAIEHARLERPLDGSAQVRVQTLLDTPHDALSHALVAHARGVRAFKLKIGASDDELALIPALRAALGDEVRLVADANGTLAPGDPRLRALADAGFALIEDPFPLALLRTSRSTVPLEVALDEPLPSTSDDDVARLIDARIVDALVLKPTLLGLARALRLARLGAPACASHTYESPLGMTLCATLACALGDRVVHGIAPYAGLDAWHLEDGAAISVPSCLRSDGVVERPA